MTDESDNSGKQRYVWPWFLLAAVLLGLVLAIVWMSFLARRIHEQRESNPWPPMTAPVSPTNPPPAKTNGWP